MSGKRPPPLHFSSRCWSYQQHKACLPQISETCWGAFDLVAITSHSDFLFPWIPDGFHNLPSVTILFFSQCQLQVETKLFSFQIPRQLQLRLLCGRTLLKVRATLGAVSVRVPMRDNVLADSSSRSYLLPCCSDSAFCPKPTHIFCLPPFC